VRVRRTRTMETMHQKPKAFEGIVKP